MFIIDLLAEYQLIVKKFIWARREREIPVCWQKGSRGDVVLIPGINERWTFLGVIGNRLNKDGWRMHYPVTDTRKPIDDITGEVENYIRQNNLVKVVIIGHSKGGLIARNLVNRINNRVKLVVILAAPHHGTILAYLPLNGFSELRLNSKSIKNISSLEVNEKIVNITPSWDNHIIPNSSLKLVGGRNVVIKVGGHTRILDASETIGLIEREIDSRMKI